MQKRPVIVHGPNEGRKLAENAPRFARANWQRKLVDIIHNYDTVIIGNLRAAFAFRTCALSRRLSTSSRFKNVAYKSADREIHAGSSLKFNLLNNGKL